VGNRIHMRAVQRATEIAEGLARLAVYLDVPPALIVAWIDGRSEVPIPMFLKVVEIIVDHAGEPLRGVIPPSLVESFRHREAANA
jgi:hypothetical protein